MWWSGLASSQPLQGWAGSPGAGRAPSTASARRKQRWWLTGCMLAWRLMNSYPALWPFPRPLPLIFWFKSTAAAQGGNSHRAQGSVPAAPLHRSPWQPSQIQTPDSSDPAAAPGSRWDLRLFLPPRLPLEAGSPATHAGWWGFGLHSWLGDEGQKQGLARVSGRSWRCLCSHQRFIFCNSLSEELDAILTALPASPMQTLEIWEFAFPTLQIATCCPITNMYYPDRAHISVVPGAFSASKIWSTLNFPQIPETHELHSTTNCRKTWDLGDSVWQSDLCFPFHPGQIVFNIFMWKTPESFHGQQSPATTAFAPEALQHWGAGQPVQPGTGDPVTTQLLYSILWLYFIFVFLQYNRIQLILHHVYKLYHNALQSKAWITW